MRISYDPSADALYIKLQDGPVQESEDGGKGIIVDYDENAEPVGIEVLQASRFFGGKQDMSIQLDEPLREGEVPDLDKKRVMSLATLLSDEEIIERRDHYSFGVVLSYFDQFEGPFPIIAIPPSLENDFQLLINLSDQSFGATGFAEETIEEKIAVFDFSSKQIRMRCISYAFAITIPEARGGKENMVLTLLIKPEQGEIINNFASELLPTVRWIHALTENKSPRENVVTQMEGLRNLVTRIIVAYQEVYGNV